MFESNSSSFKSLTGYSDFEFQGIVLDYENLKYNPCNDIIFPSIFNARDKLAAAVGAEWLMYYAPHNNPGGICLAVSDSIQGPWREFCSNPLISNEWSPYYSVSHVSSPHAVWNPDENLLFLYFHGENETTHFAVSEDGVHFKYGGIAVDTRMYENLKNTFYARVFRCNNFQMPYQWRMFFMGYQSGIKKASIYMAKSVDGRSWVPTTEPLLTLQSDHTLGAPYFCHIGDRNVLLCHVDMRKKDCRDHLDCQTDIRAYELDDDFSPANDLGVIFTHDSVNNDNDRVSDPCLIEANHRLYLFHTAGTRLRQKIALAIAQR